LRWFVSSGGNSQELSWRITKIGQCGSVVIVSNARYFIDVCVSDLALKVVVARSAQQSSPTFATRPSRRMRTSVTVINVKPAVSGRLTTQTTRSILCG
jgi:hypothetical protein